MEFTDILYEKYNGRAKITINRPDKMNTFTNHTLNELIKAFHCAWTDNEVGAVILTGAGDRSFSIGGDMTNEDPQLLEKLPMPNLCAQLLQTIRNIPKPVIAAVNGFAIGGGQVIQVVCDLTIASSNAKFGQVGPKVGSFDVGFGSAYLARIVGEKKAREIWYLCNRYTAEECLQMGLVNKVVAPEELMAEADKWADTIVGHSPSSLAAVKMSFNAASDSDWGIQSMAGIALNMYIGSEEAAEAHASFNEKRPGNYDKFR